MAMSFIQTGLSPAWTENKETLPRLLAFLESHVFRKVRASGSCVVLHEM